MREGDEMGPRFPLNEEAVLLEIRCDLKTLSGLCCPHFFLYSVVLKKNFFFYFLI